MRGWRSAGVSAAVLAAVLSSGCSADGDAEAVQDETTPAQSQQDQSTSDESLQDVAMEDEEICTAYGDVLTILENADLGLREGRMEAQEQQGWYRLATRVLDRLPSSGEGAVRQAIAELQDVAPAVPSGVEVDPAGVRSPQWYAAEEDLGDACEDVDVVLTIAVFTGG